MRPCVTARKRRQGSLGQVRECTGPAMPQHTYTQRAHKTHSPAHLPVPVGRHPGLCLLVTAPSAHPAPPAAALTEPYALHNPAAVRQHLRGLGEQHVVLYLRTSGTSTPIWAATLVQAATMGGGVRDFLFDAFLHVA